MRALVLSGGSIKGAFQAGAIAEVLKNGFKPDLIFGVSVGSLNGGFLADRAGATIIGGRSVTWNLLGNDLLNFWTANIRSFDDIGKKRGKIGIFWKILNKDFSGLLKMGAITDLLREELRPANIQRSPALFHAGVVDLGTGAFFNATHATAGDDLIEYIIASTREPIIMPIHFWQDRPLVDGGLRNIAPLGEAMKAGASEIVVISCQAEEIETPSDRMNYEDFFAVAGRSVDVLTNEIINNDLRTAAEINAYCLAHGNADRGFAIGKGDALHAGHRYVPIKVIRPDAPIRVSITDFDAADIQRMINDGREKARQVLTRDAAMTSLAPIVGAGPLVTSRLPKTPPPVLHS